MSLPTLPRILIEPLVRMALLEDLGRAGDLTTDAIVPVGHQATALVVARQQGIVAGLDLARLASNSSIPRSRCVSSTMMARLSDRAT